MEIAYFSIKHNKTHFSWFYLVSFVVFFNANPAYYLYFNHLLFFIFVKYKIFFVLVPSRSGAIETTTNQCDQCEYSAHKLGNLKQHKAIQHEGVRYPCDQCKFAATSKVTLKKHKFNKHLGVRHPCDKCEFTSKSAAALKVHKKTRHNEEETKEVPSESRISQIDRVNVQLGNILI